MMENAEHLDRDATHDPQHPLNSFYSFQREIILDAREKRIPVSVGFELTARCNLRCQMCYICGMKDSVTLKERELTAAQWISLAKDARDNGTLFLLLTGGEVLLRKDFPEIYTALSEMGFFISIYTNGTLLTPELVELFRKRRPFEISVTLYGSSRETYQTVTGSANAYDSVMQGIAMMREAGLPYLLKTLITKLNRHDLAAIYSFVTGQGLPFSWVEYVEPRREGEGTCPEEVRLSPAERLEVEKELMMLDAGYAEEWHALWNSELEPYEVFPCNAGRTGFWVSWSGKMLLCSSMLEPALSLFENGVKGSVELNKKTNVKTAWAQMISMQTGIHGCKVCEACPDRNVCNRCPAVLKAESGSHEQTVSYLCEYARLKKIMTI